MKPRKFIGYGRQSIDDDDKAAVLAALDSDFLTQGPAVERFEEAFAAKVGARHAIAVASGTAALHLTCLAGGLGPGDKAVTSDITFLASANAPKYCGSDIRFADVDSETVCINQDTLNKALQGERVKAVIPVHFAGLPVPLAALQGMADLVIEDAAHALGAVQSDGKPVGSCSHSDMAIFSFHPVKAITTAEGGMVTTNCDDLADRVRMLRNHGIERDAGKFVSFRSGASGPWCYEQHFLGFNYRMTDIQAALGLSQLKKLDGFIARRKQIVEQYDIAFKDVPWIEPIQTNDENRKRSGHHLFVARFDFETIKSSRKELMASLRERGIGTQVHYIPLHLQPFHKESCEGQIFGNAASYYERCLSLPLFPGMTEQDVAYVIENTITLTEC